MHFNQTFVVLVSLARAVTVVATPIARDDGYASQDSLIDLEETESIDIPLPSQPQTRPSIRHSLSPYRPPPPSDCEQEDNLTPWGTVKTCGPPPLPKGWPYQPGSQPPDLNKPLNHLTVITAADVTWCRPWPSIHPLTNNALHLYKWTELNLTCWVNTDMRPRNYNSGRQEHSDIWVKTGSQGCYINENDFGLPNIRFDQILRACQPPGAHPLEPNPGGRPTASPYANQTAKPSQATPKTTSIPLWTTASPKAQPTIILPDPKSSEAMTTIVITLTVPVSPKPATIATASPLPLSMAPNPVPAPVSSIPNAVPAPIPTSAASSIPIPLATSAASSIPAPLPTAQVITLASSAASAAPAPIPTPKPNVLPPSVTPLSSEPATAIIAGPIASGLSSLSSSLVASLAESISAAALANASPAASATGYVFKPINGALLAPWVQSFSTHVVPQATTARIPLQSGSSV
ncbi:hypothetical protein BT63DRAFT_413840 [Microthyrium microscopicum]|uniref:Uncharacterized protein n=1 Tax=Microthyrium microscopicum TaxID=703497 RepID=A0A6A6UAY1_9PEZI|nr:hypothetical protein BT63DRAFT_413840 [Microthyrium microscopicum]